MRGYSYRKTRLFTIAVLLALRTAAAAADDGGWYFTHFTSENSGLSFNNANDVSQDSNGFIWVATEDGLNRFDGTRFVTYYRDRLGVNTDFITALCPDAEGNIWIGTDAGATFYSYMDDAFFPLDAVSDNGVKINSKVTQISIGKDGKAWLSVNGHGLFSYDRSSGELKNYFSRNGRSILPANIRSFLIDSNGEFYLALYFADLWHSDSSLQNIEKVSLEGWKANDDIMSIVQNPVDNTVYLAAWQNGLCQADLRKGTFKTLIDNKVGFRPTDLYVDRDKGVWLSTTSGLYRYDALDGSVKRFSHSVDNKFSIADDAASAVFLDRSGGLWVATLSSGINWSAAFQRNFTRYCEADGEPLLGCYVIDMAVGGDGKVWAVTDKKGLLHIGDDGMFHRYRSSEFPNSIFSICSDDNSLWLGSWSGIYRMDIRTGKITVYDRDELTSGLRDNKVHKLFRTSSNEILAGTTLGMMRYDRASDRFVPLPVFSGIYVTDMVEALDGTLWVSSYADGISRYSMSEDRVLCHYGHDETGERHLPADKIMSVIIDRDGTLWAGAYGGGIMRHDRESNSFEVFDGLKNNRIAFSMIRDEEGTMWVATSNGLTSFSIPFSNVRYYTVGDGLLDGMVDGHTALRTPDGNLWFSSHNGIISFNPRKFYMDGKMPPIALTALYINGEKVSPGKDSPIAVNVNEVRKMTLSSRQNTFGFSMSLLGFSSPAMKSMYYMLDGYDGAWRRLDDGSVFTYQNVPAGKYTLKIKGMDSSGIWNDVHPPLSITVRAVFYKTTAAYLIYALMLSVLMVVMARYSSSVAVKRERKRSEKAKRVREEELFREKMDFFSNIIHEIKTPLTLIKTPLQNIIASGNFRGDVMEDLNVISNSTDYLDKLVKELLEFIRIEKHGWVMDYRRLDIVERISFLYFNFKETAKNRNLKMTFVHPDRPIMINADEAGLLKILNNLFSNAVKYAETYICVEVADEGDGYVRVSFRNDGMKIPDARKEDIFKPFIQFSGEKSPYSQSFGIGLPLARTLAEMHGGTLTLDNGDVTEFILKLPVRSPENAVEAPAGGAEIPENAEAAALPEESAASSPDRESVDETKPTLLVVEDNVELASYMVRKLGAEYNAFTVPSAEQALDVLARLNVDIILSDISLGGMSGIELCGKVTSDINYSHIPVIMLSALSSPEVKVKCMEAGACLYIEKPFSLEYLMESVRVIAKKRRSLKDAHFSGSGESDPGEFVLTDSDAVFLKRLEEAVTDNLSDTEFGPDELAAAALVSRSTLVRKMKSLLDMTPNDYIKTRRLNAAASMLKNGAKRINDVCYAVGFNTPSYFAKCFKKQFGVLPADYMKNA